MLIIAPCGFDVIRTLQELHLLTGKQGWHELEAVKNQKVFVVDFNLFTQPSASTLVDGIELLAALFHPELFSVPGHLEHRFKNIATIKTLA